MDRESRELAADFVARYIYEQNYQFDFDALKEGFEGPQRPFVLKVVQRLSNICYHKNIKKNLPDWLKELVGSGEPVEPETQFAQSPDNAIITEWLNLKKPPQEIAELFESGEALESAKPEAMKIFTELLLVRGKKTLEHTKIGLIKFCPVLVPHFKKSVENQVQFLDQVKHMWAKDPLRMEQLMFLAY